MEIANTYNWGDLPVEIAAKIRERIELYDDYQAFSEMCWSWRLAIKQFPGQYINRKHTQLPWLMLVDPDDSSYRRFYSLTKHHTLKIDLSPHLSPPQTRRYFSSRGWLISLTRNISKSTPGKECFNISIFNPFSSNNETIHAPLFDLSDGDDVLTEWKDDFLLSFFEKIVVSTCPNNAKDDFAVAIIFGGYCQVAYWRLGHGDTWVAPHSLDHNMHLQELCFFRGELYATQCNNVKCRVIAFGDLKDNKNGPRPRVVADLGLLTDMYQFPSNMEFDVNYFYLVESKSDEANTSSLLVIHRCVFVESGKEHKYNTALFNVFKCNVDNGNVENVKSLGNQAVFVGLNSAFAVLACANVDDDRGCKADCIYFTDDTIDLHNKNQGGGSDMGIYSLPQGNTLPFYEGPSRFSFINPPIWIEVSTMHELHIIHS